jgi:hypothetical protein
MLLKSKISGIKILSEEWYISRLAKLTSSKNFHLIEDGKGYTNYIRDKVGEELTGKSSEKEFDTESLRWGSFYEAEAVTKVGQSKGLEFIIVQQLVTAPLSRFGSTPDGLIILSETPDKTAYNVETLEVKCPPTFNIYIGLFECNTPQELKSECKQYYWQVIDQMDECGALKGHFAVYHPDFKVGNMNIIEFDTHKPVINKKGETTYPIHEDLKLLRLRKAKALETFDSIRSRLMNSGRY